MSASQPGHTTMSIPLATCHAPAERTDPQTLATIAAALDVNEHVQAMLEGFPEIAVVLDENRQVVACNEALLRITGVKDRTALIGRRVGEILGCVHAVEMPGRCGTAESCRVCGALNAMVASQNEHRTVRSACHILTDARGGPAAWELEVVATPVVICGHELTVFAVRDISAENRRAALERIFFHDALNVAGGIRGYADYLAQAGELDREDVSRQIQVMTTQLIEQIRGQRDLAAAERGELAITPQVVSVAEVLEAVRTTYAVHPVGYQRTILCRMPTPLTLRIHTDPVLLQRVLGNLVKNALEASEPGGTVTISTTTLDASRVRFVVHNETVMPEDVKLQIFQRSFSTKGGTGRGLGTFSIKLLITRYLGGDVTFTSHAPDGTTFLVTLPIGNVTEAAGTGTSEARQPAPLDGKRVLLAEDSADNQRLLAFFLTKAGAQVVVADNGQVAVDRTLAAAETPFDIVLMDVQMPVRDGLWATRELRVRGYNGPIIALTAFNAESDIAACTDGGCDGHLCKPLDRHTLITAVAGYIGRSGAPGPTVTARSGA